MTRSARWTTEQVGDLSGRRMLVTGANSGIGWEAAKVLAAHGAHVVLACRDTAKGERAAQRIRATSPGARVEVIELDLADLASVQDAAETFAARHGRLDVLCNNAGVMWLPYRMTADGFEMQFGTNHLGHFALTGRLLGLLLAADAPRVVTVSSNLHRGGAIDFGNLDAGRGYDPRRAYAQSKLANLLFTFELQRRADAAGTALTASVAAHPGWAATNLQTAGPRMAGAVVTEQVHRLANRLFAQSAAGGALPTVRAAVDPQIRGGDYVGPSGPGQLRGAPAAVSPSSTARAPEVATRLWEASEALTGVRYDALAAAPC